MRRDRASALLLVVGVVGCFGAAASCGKVSGLDPLIFDLPGGGGTGNRSTSSSSGSSSGTGGMTGCTEASQCPAVPAGPCASLGKATCTGGVCGVTYTVGPAPSQQYGSCHHNECAADGGFSSVEDDTNVFVSGNDCMLYKCSNGLLNSINTQGSTCVPDGGSTATGFCEPNPDPTNTGLELCSQCNPLAANTCPTGSVCDHGTCKPTHCTNNMTDTNETDVDCGGPDCFPCGPNKMCSTHDDCFSQQCSGGMCAAPGCKDGFQDGAETDTDCGGGTCPVCADGKICLQPTDCESGVCLPQMPTGSPNRCAVPSCTDGVKNGGEKGVDCGGDDDGGVTCPPCAPGL